MRLLFRIIVGIFALVGFLIVGTGVGVGVFVAHRGPAPPPSESLLEWVADGPMGSASSGRLGALMDDPPSLDHLVQTLDAARADPRVKGLIARLGAVSMRPAEIQELRAAITRFRATGKFTAVHASSYDTSSYWLASAFGEVWMQPSGVLAATGPMIDEPFAREAFDTLGIEPRFERREGYKSAPESMTERAPTPQHREMTGALVADIGRQFVEAVATDRHLDISGARAAIDRAPLLEDEATAAKLVDRLGWRDEFTRDARRRAGDAKVVDIRDYTLPQPEPAAAEIAVIRAVGNIVDGESRDGVRDEVTPGRLVPAFEAAARASDVRAVVFRVDSGGGSAAASDAIRRAVTRTREAGKPVIVSMGGVAASGGYWIAMNANRIVAEPATLTGSIGVFVGKLSFEGLSNRLGVRWEGARDGRNAGMWSPLRPFDDGGVERIKAMADHVYARFLSGVGEARGLSPEAARAVAGGRVWTGAQARENGLVDVLGGMDEALVEARRAARLPDDAPIKLREFPAPKTPLEEIKAVIAGNRGLLSAARTLADAPAVLDALAVVDATAGSLSGGGVQATASIPAIR